MSQRLSTSVTFQNLEDRVSTLESGQVLTQAKVITALGYTPANIAGDSFGYVNARTFIGSFEVGGGSANLSGSSVTGYTGVVEFRRADGTRNGFLGFNAETGPMHYGSDTGAGHYFEGGPISNDPAMRFGLRFNTVDGILDFDTGDYLYYSRSTDTFLFNIGGATKATLDSGGVLSATRLALDGQFYQAIASSTHNPLINFDSNDYLAYDRTGNVYTFNIAGSSALNVTTTGVTANGLSAPVISADANFYLTVNSGLPYLSFDANDTLSYDRNANAYRFSIGNTSQLQISSGAVNVTNVLTVGDGNLGMSLNGGSPYVAFDSGDALLFNRSTNAYNLTLSNSTQLLVDPSGTFVANILTVGDSNFGMSLNGGGQPISYFDSGDFLGYVRASNIFNFVIGGATKATVDGNGVVVATQFQADPNCYFYVSGGTMPQFVVDSGDAIRFDRAANKFYFIVGNVAVASIDASGNLRIKGTLSQGVTP